MGKRAIFAIILTLFLGTAGGAQPRSFVSGFSFNPDTGITTRFITPNGDGLNDSTIFTFTNSRDSSISGRIYDIRGAVVATMTAGPAPANASDSTLRWDGKSGGQVVSSGLYIYVIRGESNAYAGLLVVVK